MSEIDEIRMEQVEKIQSAVEEKYSGQEEDLQKYAEMSLDEVLAVYVGDDRNYIVDCAEIECSEMSRNVHCIKYENGKTKLYNVTNEAKGVERDSIPPEGKPGETISFGKTIDISKVRRLYALHAEGASDNGIRFATVSDRECLRNVREDIAKAVNPNDGMSVSCEANIISCGNCGILRQADIAEIEKRMDQSIEYGTCYSLIKPVTEWTNPLCTERLVGKCDNKVSNTIYTGGKVKTVCIRTDHHKTMKFDTDSGEKEGLTMLSTLLCTRGGVITIKMHGQIYLGNNMEDRIQELMDSIEGKPMNSLDEMRVLSTVEILARMIYQESHTYKNDEQNAIVYSFVNRIFSDKKFTNEENKTLKNMLFEPKQYQSLRKDSGNYPNSYCPPISQNDDAAEKEGWENAKRLAAILVIALEDNVPAYDSDRDIGEIAIENIGDYKEDTCEMIRDQKDSCGESIENPIGDRPFFHRVEGSYVAKEGEIIMHTSGKEENAGNVFHY